MSSFSHQKMPIKSDNPSKALTQFDDNVRITALMSNDGVAIGESSMDYVSLGFMLSLFDH